MALTADDMEQLCRSARGVGYSEALSDVMGVVVELQKDKTDRNDFIERFIGQVEALQRKGPTHA